MVLKCTNLEQLLRIQINWHHAMRTPLAKKYLPSSYVLFTAPVLGSQILKCLLRTRCLDNMNPRVLSRGHALGSITMNRTGTVFSYTHESKIRNTSRYFITYYMSAPEAPDSERPLRMSGVEFRFATSQPHALYILIHPKYFLEQSHSALRKQKIFHIRSNCFFARDRSKFNA